MNKTMITLSLMMAGLYGCASGKKVASIPTSESVTDISAPAPAFASAPSPVAQPVMAAEPTAASASASAGGSYTVKKGDTLYGIARNHYGDGKAWAKIASANPGVSPQTLKVGQTITLP